MTYAGQTMACSRPSTTDQNLPSDCEMKYTAAPMYASRKKNPHGAADSTTRARRSLTGRQSVRSREDSDAPCACGCPMRRMATVVIATSQSTGSTYSTYTSQPCGASAPSGRITERASTSVPTAVTTENQPSHAGTAAALKASTATATSSTTSGR